MIRPLKVFKEKVSGQVSNQVLDKEPDATLVSRLEFDFDSKGFDLDDRYGFGSNCFVCAHFHGVVILNCAAFPRRFPPEVWDGTHPHTTPYPGDNGILFEPREDCISPFAPKEEPQKQKPEKT